MREGPPLLQPLPGERRPHARHLQPQHLQRARPHLRGARGRPRGLLDADPAPRDLFLVQHETGFGLDAAFPSFWSIPGATALHGHAGFLSLAPYLLKVRLAFPFDVVVGCNAYPDGGGRADLAAVARVPLVQNVIGSDVNELPSWPALRPQIRWALGRAGRVVAVSHDMAERVVELGIPRARVLGQHNGVDGETFALRDKAEARRRVGVDHAGPVILYVGNVKISKGAKVLVEAMAPLARSTDAATPSSAWSAAATPTPRSPRASASSGWKGRCASAGGSSTPRSPGG